MNRRWPYPHKDSEFAMSFIMNNGRVQLEFYVDDKNSTLCLISLSLYSYFLFLILFYFFRGLHHFVEIGFNMYLEHPKSEDQTTK